MQPALKRKERFLYKGIQSSTNIQRSQGQNCLYLAKTSIGQTQPNIHSACIYNQGIQLVLKMELIGRNDSVERVLQKERRSFSTGDVDHIKTASKPKRRPSVGLLAEVLGDYARHEEETTLNRQRYEEAMLNVFGSKGVIPPQSEHTGPTLPFPSLCSQHLSNPHFAFYMGIIAK